MTALSAEQIAEANSAMHAAACKDGWQPIETAPKEGVMLVYMPEEEHRPYQVMYRSGRFTVIGGAFGFDLSKPTHWMPLPAPPSRVQAVGE